jgi:anaerobic selenocysteine-containing dehydrogenase
VEGAIAEPLAKTRTILLNQLGEALTSAAPPIKVLFSFNINPLSTIPHQNLVEQGLKRDDLFTVVFDQVMTDSARFADVVLPATTFLEHDEMSRGYGAYVLHRSRPVMPPVGESRSNASVFLELIGRLGLGRQTDPNSPDDLVSAILRETPDGERLAQDLAAQNHASPGHGQSFIQMKDVMPLTPDGRIHLFPETLESESVRGLYVPVPEEVDERFPFALISPATSMSISSSLAQTTNRPAHVMIHPSDAQSFGIKDGDSVSLSNALGEVIVLAKLSTQVRRGVLSLAKGLWAKHTTNGKTSNALCPDTLSDIGQGACFNDARVALARV